MLVSVSLFRLRSAASGNQVAGLAAAGSHAALGYEAMFSPDQLAAEQSYRTVYVPALRRLPGLERYLVGRVFTWEGRPTEFSHIAVMFWRDRAAWEGATAPGVSERLGVPPVAEWVESLMVYTGDLDAVPPVEPSPAKGVLALWLLRLRPTEHPGENERYYRDVFAPFERQFPGIRAYLTGPIVTLRSAPLAYDHLTLMEYESWSALQPSGVPDRPPAWIRPMNEWCQIYESYSAEFEEVLWE